MSNGDILFTYLFATYTVHVESSSDLKEISMYLQAQKRHFVSLILVQVLNKF